MTMNYVIVHQQKQIKVVKDIEKQISQQSLQFSTVTPINDYANDRRMSLTSVHLPHKSLVRTIQNTLSTPLKMIEPFHYYYTKDNLHMTIKNIKVIHYPPQFTSNDVKKTTSIFNNVIPKYKKFNVFFYRLMLFPHSLSLIGTTEPELDSIIFELDTQLKKAGIPDNKKYVNSRFFFSNITLARFTSPPSIEYKNKIIELSANVRIPPYEVDSVSLLTCNAVLAKKIIHDTWFLRD